MNPRKHLKFISVISVVSIVTIVGMFQIDPSLAVYVAVLADVIQVVSYFIWLLQKEVPLEKVPKQVEIIYKYVREEKESYRVKEELVSRLVNEGVIPESELYALVRDLEIFLAFPYGTSFPDGVKKLGFERPPHIALLEEIGFVRVTPNQNLMVAFSDRLPKSLRSIDNLDTFIEHELPKIWNRISEQVKEKFPSTQYKWYEKWRTGKGFGVLYVLSKSMAREFIINYINTELSTTEFKNRVWGVINRKELKRAIKKRMHHVKEVISKTSIDILLVDMPKTIKKRILEHEDDIKKRFNIRVFTDYRFIEKTELEEVILQLLPRTEKENADRYSSKIIDESQKCYHLLKALGITM